MICKDLPVHRFRQRIVRDRQPLQGAQFPVRGADLFGHELRSAQHTVSCAAHRGTVTAPKAFELTRERRIGSLQGKGRFPVHDIFSRHKNAESRFKIVILRDLIVETVTLRAAAGQSHRQKRKQLRESLPEHGFADLCVKSFGKLHSVHRQYLLL